jgi:hypothetical protein
MILNPNSGAPEFWILFEAGSSRCHDRAAGSRAIARGTGYSSVFKNR